MKTLRILLALSLAWTAALDPRASFRVPAVLRFLLGLPFLRTLPARVIGLGFKRVHVEL